MFGRGITFDSPGYLVLLILLPVIWTLSYRSLAGLGRWRRLWAIGIRSAVLLLLIAALAEAQLQRTSERLSVLYLLDQSASIPAIQRQAMLEYAYESAKAHRESETDDQAGMIVFGRDATIESPPYDDDLPLVNSPESLFSVKTDSTNLAAALKLAQATFSEGSARRIVLVTDGNENIGNAAQVARTLARDGIGIDVVPILLEQRSEVVVEKVTIAQEVRRGQPVEARIVIDNRSVATADDPGMVSGKLRLIRRNGESEQTLNAGDEAIVLKPGKNVITFSQTIDQPDFYTYEAQFTPDDPLDDLMTQNNRASAFTRVRGKGRVLLIEDAEFPGEFDLLVDRLKAMDIAVTVQQTDQLFTSLAELRRYDSVVLANVPRSSGAGAGKISSFSETQIKWLTHNTHELGSGLVMIGGDRSYGAGGWANTELEKALPVDFTVKNKKVRAAGALVLLMHASEMQQGNYWQKVVARESIKMLGPMDYCGVIHWNDMKGRDDWLWGGANGIIEVGQRRAQMMQRVGRMTPGDMPQFDPGLRRALLAFNKLQGAAVKHMIIVSDGDPTPPSGNLIRQFKNAPPKGIQITTVAVGAHGGVGHATLKNIASATGGKYYVVSNPKALPKIYQREVRRVARPLVFEQPVNPQVTYRHEMLRGIDENVLPQIKGFVLTTVKDDPQVEVSLMSPKPADPKNASILASWNYGLGRSVALTTDAGAKWADEWTSWDKYDLLYSQIVRWSMRPIEQDAHFDVATTIENNKVQVVVSALDKDDQFLNFLEIAGTAVGPDGESRSVKLRQVAPGRYTGSFDAEEAGSYFMTLSRGANKAPIISGISIPYSAEFRDHRTNTPLITRLAALPPTGGEPGQVITGDMVPGKTKSLLSINTFRHNLAKAISNSDIWPLLAMLASCVFLGDVFVRRVHIGFEWLQPITARVTNFVLRREPPPPPDERLDRLRSLKRQVAAGIDERRGSIRFEPDAMESPSEDTLREELAQMGGGQTKRSTAKNPQMEGEQQEQSHTSRLLKAKDEVRRRHGGGSRKNKPEE